MTVFLTVSDVCQFNEHLAGPNLLRDLGILQSAVFRPQTSAFGEDAYPTIHEKAAALLHSLARNHPFIDGNKRTAWAATRCDYPPVQAAYGESGGLGHQTVGLPGTRGVCRSGTRRAMPGTEIPLGVIVELVTPIKTATFSVP